MKKILTKLVKSGGIFASLCFVISHFGATQVDAEGAHCTGRSPSVQPEGAEQSSANCSDPSECNSWCHSERDPSVLKCDMGGTDKECDQEKVNKAPQFREGDCPWYSPGCSACTNWSPWVNALDDQEFTQDTCN